MEIGGLRLEIEGLRLKILVIEIFEERGEISRKERAGGAVPVFSTEKNYCEEIGRAHV